MINKEILYSILKIQSYIGQCDEMQSFIIDYAHEKGYYYDMDDTGNIYIIKGESETYPCIVAHMDTVHKINKGSLEIGQYAENPDIIFGMNPLGNCLSGIGGDDKCGIYAALHCLQVLPHCKVALFVDEECGCVGSRQSNLQFFENCRFVLQADRRGNSDFVTDILGALSSQDFIKDAKSIFSKYGYSACHGMMTDVQILRDRNVGISVANMSAGYYNPHSDREYINLSDLENVCNLMVDICENMEKTYPFTAPVRRHSFYRRNKTFIDDRDDDKYSYPGWWDAALAEEEDGGEGYIESIEEQDPAVLKIMSMTDQQWIDSQIEEEESFIPHNPALRSFN